MLREQSGPVRVSKNFQAESLGTRIAIFNTPRSGSTLLRLILANTLDLVDMPAHHPADIDWQNLPDRVIVHIHWPRTAYLDSLLNQAQMRVVTISRHPFDVLLSILRYAQLEPRTSEWLWGDGGDEDEIVGADPTSTPFALWATSDRARALLNVTDSWLSHSEVTHVRYDPLVRSAEAEITRLLTGWSLSATRSVADVVYEYRPSAVNNITGSEHARSASDSWQDVFPRELVAKLAVQYKDYLAHLGLPVPLARDINDEDVRSRWKDSLSGWPDSMYRGHVGILDAPERVSANSHLSALVKLENHGTLRWPHRMRNPLVRVGCRWLLQGGDGTVLLEDRYQPDTTIAPGTAHYTPITFRTPATPGSYLVDVDLVHEHVRWFNSGVQLSIEVA